jgi:hypothetical protein
MRSDHYVHPEFGLLSPRPRLRRELRIVFFSVLFGIAIGAAAVIALSVNKTSDDAQVPGPSSASVLSEKPAEAILNNGVKEGHINESDGIKVVLAGTRSDSWCLVERSGFGVRCR